MVSVTLSPSRICLQVTPKCNNYKKGTSFKHANQNEGHKSIKIDPESVYRVFFFQGCVTREIRFFSIDYFIRNTSVTNEILRLFNYTL